MIFCPTVLSLAAILAFSPSLVALHEQSPQRADTLHYHSRAIVVTGSRAETPIERTPVRVEVVEGAQAKATAISTVGELLREQAGVLLAPGSIRSGVQLMGLNPDYTLILLDGQPLTGRVGGAIDLQRLSVGNVERVEIVRGPLSSLYGGDALAGVINIITKRPAEGWSGRWLGRYLYHGASELQLEQLYGGDDIEGSIYGVARRCTSFDIFHENERFAYPSITDYTLHGRLRWNPSSRLRATAGARLFSSLTEGSLLQAQAGQITTAQGELNALDASVSGGVEWYTAVGRFTAQLYGTAYREGYRFVLAEKNGSSHETDSSDSFVRRTGRAYIQYDRIFSMTNRAMAGVEFLYDDAGGMRYPDQPSYRTVAAFVQWEGNPFSRLSYALSLRSDWTSAFGTPRSVLLGGVPILPRFSIRYALSPAVALNLTIGEGFKAPDMRQLFIRFSPAGVGYQLLGARVLGLDLQPEQSLSLMGGITVSFDTLDIGRLRVGAVMVDGMLFFNRLRNMIEYFAYQQSPLVFTYRNVAAVQTYGLLLTASATLDFEEHQFSLRGSYQWLAAYDERVLDAIRRGTAGYLIPSTGQFYRLRRGEYYGLWYRSFHSGTLRVDWRYHPWDAAVNMRAQYVGAFGDLQRAANADIYDGTQYLGQLLDSPKELVPGYWMLNLGIEKRLRADAVTFVVAVGVNNLLDIVNPRYVPTLIGRQGFCSVQVEW
ncbi:MAG: TonB-dependent receptor [Bacteroidota bacterium]|nr:TonB-dependent receptor [Candidatus Kapabacteria bacterium]MDW8271881.1 TonB-dependent receptor [Bacteroidota bacterium]